MAWGRILSHSAPLAGMIAGGLIFAGMIAATAIFGPVEAPPRQEADPAVLRTNLSPAPATEKITSPLAPSPGAPHIIAGDYDGRQSELLRKILLQVGDVPARHEEVRIALVIGNAGYAKQGWTLENPINDARLIANRLRSLDFDVDLVENTTKAQMSAALRRYKQRMSAAGEKAVSVVYFAGHGIQDDKVNYLVPVDAEIEDAFDIEDWSMRLDRILRVMRETGNFVNIVLLDACRNNPVSDPTRGIVRAGLAEVPMELNFMISFAAQPGRPAYDGGGNNSPYALALSKALDEHSDKPIHALMVRVRTMVREATNRRQTPDYKDGLLDAPFWAFGGGAKPDDEETFYDTSETEEEKALGAIAVFLDKQDFTARDNQTWDVLDVVIERFGIALLEQLAATGHPNAQTVLARAYEDGRHVKENKERAKVLLISACNGGQVTACNNLGALYDRRGSEEDYKNAAPLFRQACDNGLALSCTNLGSFYRTGKGVAKDDEKAANLFRQACAGGSSEGCSRLGSMYRDSRGVPQNDEKAVALYRQACHGGSSAGCNNLGWMYQNGRGVEQDDERAVALFRQACDAGSSAGCRNLGWIFLNGHGVEQNTDEAQRYFRKACGLGDQEACGRLN